ncbi:flagellar biosynthetic protein FliR [Campylobacter sp. LH-2024]|uniref:Flagellar type III secretion system protein FliR n=1 Tax=Campylobacter molothri TaxID=1032242 RepID=A0ACC5W292_9BACT|nr:flagellar biosynthetic protein FliR [Campylobacter sp. 2018MI35]MBZ7928249.1 flagellar type III secretion system protein FliR [Campylobacter sp. RM10542]MBZ7930017.1 flagellar type III secretion system protein FliR [Campylobacter sp. W0067]MBZ7931040.1 flagellar type III secretion system protein FliR [Campylobacter sp. RM12910]MBZ7932546.1 flagellar type III secretion system protein FliR [Campylobacter sp. RM10543]MBZ7937507.1 flagellar type III secretion system protein FliR [Campylobacter 
MEFVNYLGDKNVATFMLLFARMSGLIVFFPFFSHNSIPIVIKTTLALFLTMYLYPLAKLENLHLDSFFVIQLLSEVIFGMIAGLILQIIFAIIMMAGEQIAFIMGFTMANVLDPSSGTNMPITSQILHLIALLFFLAFNGHHLILLFLSYSLGYIDLGAFYPQENLMRYLNSGILNIFIIGFTMSFPILGISLLTDTIFGLLMKTMPQFNLLVIGYPIKIALGIIVLIVILIVMMEYFKDLILEAITHMQTLFFV